MELTLDQALQRAIKAHKAGQVQEADRLYTAILKAQPQHPDANHNMGVLAVGVGKFQEALPFFKTALEANPSMAQYWMSYIDALIKLERLDDAQAVLNQAKEKGAKGEGFNKLERQLQGLEPTAIVTSSTQDPPNDQLQPLIELYSQGQFQQALDEVSLLLKQFPNSVALYNICGATNKGLGKLDSAIINYKKAINFDPDYAEARSNMGVALQEQGRLEEATEALRKALAIKPDYVDAFFNIGNVFQEGGKFEDAIEAYKKALAIKPDYADAYNNLGNALKDQGKLKEAAEAFNKAIAIKPDYADAHNNLGFTLQEGGKLEEAIKTYKKALDIKPNHTEAWNNIVLPLQAIKTEILSKEDPVFYYSKDVSSKYFQIAKAILNYRLNQGKESASNSLNETLGLLASADNIIVKNSLGSQSSKDLAPILPDKIIALVHFGRSGTGLLHSLIDGHPDVSTLPSIYFSEYFDHSTWEKIISGGWSEMANCFIAIYDVLFDAASTVPIKAKSKQLLYNIGAKEGMMNVGGQQNEVLKVDKKLFCSELNHLMDYHDELDAFIFFKLAQAAYDKAINDLNCKSLIFYHIHNPDTYAQLNFVRSAPNANWVMMIREPIQSCESWLRKPFQKNEYREIANKIFGMLFEIDNIIYHKQNSIGIRLEDLKENPRKTIPALCNWMGIEESESLYEMTAQGKEWWGDPTSPDYSKDGMNPFGKTSIKRKVGLILSDNDQLVLKTLFYPFSVRFGYVEENPEQFKDDLQTIRPMLDQMFGFEKTIVERTEADPEQFTKSGSYLYLRSGLIERWNTLNEYHTYPNMIKPLEID